ncbi:hypothetical protein JTB14_025353 [Gonioctena quinquepunctata]|nr:hypothetical protein JTB14_025353 [Gonioctena quinquepunctata]
MEWTNEKVINLINLYWDRPVLWDCRLKDYKDRNKKMDALLEIADQQTSDENVEVTQEETQDVDPEPLEDSDVTSESGKKGSKRKLFKSPSARSHSQKKHKFSATEEALSIMEDIQVRNALKDQYTAFGDQVGMRIRDLPTLNAKQIVKHLISNILFEAEIRKYDNPNSVNTTYSQPFYIIPHFSQSPFSSPVVPGYIPSDPPHPHQRSYSDQMPTTIQHSLPSPIPPCSYAPTDSDSMDSILMEL